MLVLSRKISERICVGDGIEIMVCAVSGNRVKVGVSAPSGTRIVRGEKLDNVGIIGVPCDPMAVRPEEANLPA